MPTAQNLDQEPSANVAKVTQGIPSLDAGLLPVSRVPVVQMLNAPRPAPEQFVVVFKVTLAIRSLDVELLPVSKTLVERMLSVRHQAPEPSAAVSRATPETLSP